MEWHVSIASAIKQDNGWDCACCMMDTFAQLASVHHVFHTQHVLPAWRREDGSDCDLVMSTEYIGLTMRASDMPDWRLFLTVVLKVFYHNLMVTNPKGLGPVARWACLCANHSGSLTCCNWCLCEALFCQHQHCSSVFTVCHTVP